MRTHVKWVLGCLVALGSVSALRAGPAIEVGKLELYPTYLAVGIELDFTGDDNQNAGASFVWKKAGEKDWRTGVDMTIDRKHRKIWASVWPLEQGTAIEVEIRVVDPDAAKLTPVEGKTTVKTLVLDAKGGRTLYVAPTGDDANPGTADKPLKTIAHAGKAAAAGDTVVLAGGTYAEGDLWANVRGTLEKPIVLKAAEGQTPVLDSSLELPAGHSWKDAGEGTYVCPIDFTGGYVAQDGLRSFPYEALADLKSDKFKAGRGWFYDKAAKQLYVRPGAKKASECRYNLSKHDYGLHLSGSKYVIVRGLEIRNYGGACVRLSEGARGNVLYENHIHNAPGGIFMKSDTTQENAIWKNHIHEPGGPDFLWGSYYSVSYGNQAIYCTNAGRGNSFCYNVIHDYFDLMSVESWKHPDKINLHRDTDIMFNELYNATDDAIEVDGGGVNMRIHGNAIRNCHTAISLAPIERGPVYVTRNHATFLAMLFKFNVGGCTSLGPTFCYHNTGQCLVSGADDAGTGFSFPKGIPSSNKTLKNNVVVVNEWCARDGKKDYVLDGNCYFAVAGRPPRRFNWDGKAFNTIEAFTTATGNEKNGLYADPLFVRVPEPRPRQAALGLHGLVKGIADGGDLRLKLSSPCIDRAVRIAGINDDFQGKAPDMGAFEMK